MGFKNILMIFVIFLVSMLKASVFSEEDMYRPSAEYNLVRFFPLGGQSDKVFSKFINLTRSSVFKIYRLVCINFKRIYSCSFKQLHEVVPGQEIGLNGKFGSINASTVFLGYFITNSELQNTDLVGIRGDLIFFNRENRIQMNNVVIGVSAALDRFTMNKIMYQENMNVYKDMDVFNQRYSVINYNDLILIAVSPEDEDSFYYVKHFGRFGKS
ncbi:MAG: hypothetical protein K2X39_07770 [Silvanigrellaceae bacterium]|nr:hypothetical protein [Silvanigrellaceae bacterium]